MSVTFMILLSRQFTDAKIMTACSLRICRPWNHGSVLPNRREGYTFRSVYDPAADLYHYDGYIAGEGNKEQIDNENVPFVTTTGYLEDDVVPCMVLFIDKGEQITKPHVECHYGPPGSGCSGKRENDGT